MRQASALERDLQYRKGVLHIDRDSSFIAKGPLPKLVSRTTQKTEVFNAKLVKQENRKALESRWPASRDSVGWQLSARPGRVGPVRSTWRACGDGRISPRTFPPAARRAPAARRRVGSGRGSLGHHRHRLQGDGRAAREPRARPPPATDPAGTEGSHRRLAQARDWVLIASGKAGDPPSSPATTPLLLGLVATSILQLATSGLHPRAETVLPGTDAEVFGERTASDPSLARKACAKQEDGSMLDTPPESAGSLLGPP
jgi:hypothetical protein